MRLDNLICVMLNINRSQAQEFINKKLIMINGEIVSKKSQIIKKEYQENIVFIHNDEFEKLVKKNNIDTINIKMLSTSQQEKKYEENELEKILKQSSNVELLKEDKYYFIINKPYNLTCHYNSNENTLCLLDYFFWKEGVLYYKNQEKFQKIESELENFQQNLELFNNLYHNNDNFAIQNLYSGWPLVHRLDKQASGLMIIPKTFDYYVYLINIWKERKINRKYRAIVHGKILWKKRTINKPILHSSKRKKSIINTNGKEATTHLEKIQYANYDNHDFTLVECETKTGRTHQIRLHLSSIKNPIVYDNLYGSKMHSKIENRILLQSCSMNINDEIIYEM